MIVHKNEWGGSELQLEAEEPSPCIIF
jgi:hypothetical protein